MWTTSCYIEDYLDGILSLAKKNYGDIEIADRKYIEHEYFNNPAGNAIIQLAIDENNVVGQYVIVPKKMYVEGKQLIAGHPLNILVDSNYRNQGMFYKLGEQAHSPENSQNVDFFYATPNPNSSHGYQNKLAFKFLQDIPLMLKPISLLKIAKEKLLKATYPENNADTAFLFSNNHIDIIELTEGNLELADQFWENICGKYPIMMYRDGAFMKWRYLDIPIRKYRCYFAMKNGTPVGFAAITISTVANMRCGMIVDFLFLDGADKEASQLITLILRYFKVSGVTLSGCLMNQITSEAKLLKKFGYFVCPRKLQPQPFTFLIRRTEKTKNLTSLEDFKNWFFTMGDYDVI